MSECNNHSQGKPFDSYLLNYNGDIIMARLKGTRYSNKDKIGKSATKPVFDRKAQRPQWERGYKLIVKEWSKIKQSVTAIIVSVTYHALLHDR